MADLMTIGGNATSSYKMALAAVSTNISNLNTEGYSRQSIKMVADGEAPAVLVRMHDSFAGDANNAQPQGVVSASG